MELLSWYQKIWRIIKKRHAIGVSSKVSKTFKNVKVQLIHPRVLASGVQRSDSALRVRVCMRACVRGPLIAVTSLILAGGLWSAASAEVALGLSSSELRGVFPDQELNPLPLHWQADA